MDQFPQPASIGMPSGSMDNNSSINLQEGAGSNLVGSIMSAIGGGGAPPPQPQHQPQPHPQMMDMPAGNMSMNQEMYQSGQFNGPSPNMPPPPPPQQMYQQPSPQPQQMTNNNSYMSNEMAMSMSMTSKIIQGSKEPLLVAALVFLFRLKFINRFLESYFPSLYDYDTGITWMGSLIVAAVAGIVYFFSNRMVQKF